MRQQAIKQVANWLGGAAALAVMLVGGCRQVELPAPTEPAEFTRQTWWNYYQRGLANASANNWEKARQDFLQALGVEPADAFGAASDKRRIRTYGLRFLDDYFPHRELGVVYFYQGKLDDAARHLNLSLAMEPSSRAKHYLNETKRQLWRARQAQGMLPQRRIQFDLQLDVVPNEIVTRPQLQVSGVIASEVGVEKVWVNRRPVYVELAAAELRLDETVVLASGAQVVEVEVQDLLGQCYGWSQPVTVDIQAPVATVHLWPADQGKQPSRAQLVIRDDQCLQAVSIAGKPVQLAGKFSQIEVSVDLGTGKTVEVEARDHAGHVLAMQLAPELLLAGLDGGAAAPRHDLSYVALGSDLVGVPRQLPPAKQVAAAPTMTLLPGCGAEVTVTTSFYLLDILAHAPAGAARVELRRGHDGEPMVMLQSDGAVLLRASRRLELEPGRNDFVVSIRDRNGLECVKTLCVVRQLDNCWREDLRMSACLIPPALQQWPQARAIDFSGLLLEQLLAQPRRLKLVQHDLQALEQILVEKRLASGEVLALPQAVQRGELVPAEWLLVCRLTRWPGQDNWDVFLRIVDVETGMDVIGVDMHFTGFQREAIALALQGLAAKLHQQLPALTAPLLKRHPDRIEIGIGSLASIRPGYRFVFIPGDATDLQHAEPRQHNGALLQGVVTATTASGCAVMLFGEQTADLLQAHDVAVVR